MSKKQEELHQLIKPIVEAMGFEWVGIEYLLQGKYSLLRIYIDKQNGINAEDCERVSRQIGTVLDVENVISNRYTLEVSSPGLNRPLFSLEHFIHAIGKEVTIHTSEAIEGQRNFKGMIESVNDDIIVLFFENKRVELPFKIIVKANLVPQIVF